MGGWTAGIWPISDYGGRVTKQHLDDLNAAGLERGNCLGGTWIEYTYTNRNYRNALIHFKTYLKDFIEGRGISGQYFCPKQDTSTFNAYFADHPGIDARPPGHNMQSLLEDLKLPINFFDYTPYRGLSELGWVDDIEGTKPAGKAGYQNADTAAGGSVFPTGRSYWTTCDYGYDNLKLIFSKLVWVAFERTYSPDEIMVDTTWRGDGYTDNWIDAKQEAEDNYATSGFGAYLGWAVNRSFGYWLDLTIDEYWATLQTQKFYNHYYYVHYGPMHCDADFYYYAVAPSDKLGGVSQYDPLGWINLIEGQHAYNQTKAWGGGSGPFPTACDSNMVGDGSMPIPWCTTPIDQYPVYYSRGVHVACKFCIYKFDVAGGLQYT